MQSPSAALDTCLSEDVVLAFQCGETTEIERQRIHRHIDVCDNCRALLVMTAGMDGSSLPQVELDSMERIASIVGSGLRLTTFAEGKLLAHRFEVTRFVDRGGMGEVYEAFDRVVGSRVALKALLCTTPDEAPGTSRLGKEVKLARRVAHPNVCRIYDLHEHRETGHSPLRFLAMEFVEGVTLKERLLARELSIEEACAIARQLLEGLGAVHSAGVLHLDFKSQNVMLREGAVPAQAVVMDFSLSRAFEKELHLRTSERRVAGSIGYMSPEQLECKATIDPAADVYAFGVVFYEMLTRHMPFAGDSPAAIMFKQLKAKPAPPSSLRPAVSKALDEFVLTCLSRHSRARFQSVSQALDALERCVVGTAAPRSRGWRWPLWLAAAALAVGSMAAGHYLTSAAPAAGVAPAIGRAAPHLEPAPPAKPADTQAPAPGESELAPGTSPDAVTFAGPGRQGSLGLPQSPKQREAPAANSVSAPAAAGSPTVGSKPPPVGGTAAVRPASSARPRPGPAATGSVGAAPAAPAVPPAEERAPEPPSPAERSDPRGKWVPSSAPDFLL